MLLESGYENIINNNKPICHSIQLEIGLSHQDYDGLKLSTTLLCNMHGHGNIVTPILSGSVGEICKEYI